MAAEPRDLSLDEVIEMLRHVDLFQGLPDDESQWRKRGRRGRDCTGW